MVLNNVEMQVIIMFLDLIVFAFAILVAIAILKIPIIAKNVRAQTKLLSEMAKANGVNSETIAEITKDLK